MQYDLDHIRRRFLGDRRPVSPVPFDPSPYPLVAASNGYELTANGASYDGKKSVRPGYVSDHIYRGFFDGIGIVVQGLYLDEAWSEHHQAFDLPAALHAGANYPSAWERCHPVGVRLRVQPVEILPGFDRFV